MNLHVLCVVAVAPGTMGALVAASVLAQQQQQHQAVQQSSSSQNNILGGTAGLVNSNAVSTGGATNTSSMIGVQGVPGVTGLGKCDHFVITVIPSLISGEGMKDFFLVINMQKKVKKVKPRI